MSRVTPFLVGLLFGLGLCLSGMVNPVKVLGFLDLAGAWDPSLAFVMAGAIAVALPAFRLARARATPASDPLDLPGATAIDARLVGGSLLFGVGWGLVGLCPGPAIADLGFLDGRAALFVAAMAAGMAIFAALPALRAAGPRTCARGRLTRTAEAARLRRARHRERSGGPGSSDTASEINASRPAPPPEGAL